MSEVRHTKFEPMITRVLAYSGLTKLPEKHGVGDGVLLVDGSHSLQDACQRHGFDFRYEKYGNLIAIEYITQDITYRKFYFSNYSGNAESETADDLLSSFSFAWNQLI